MIERFKKLAEVEILIAVASALFGLLISPLLEKIVSPLFDTPTRSILTGLVFIAILVVITTITIGIFARRQETLSHKVGNELTSLNQRLGLTVRFVRDHPKRSEGAFHRAAREIIEQAEKEILILQNAYIDSPSDRQLARDLESPIYQKERDKYTQALRDKVMQHKNDKFFFRRVVQFPEGEKAELTEQRIGQRWREHFGEILQIIKDYPEVAYIKQAPMFLEQNIVIVDERFVIWPINAIDPENKIRYVEGTLIFDDPHQEFVRYVKGFFQRVDAHARLVQKLPEQ